MLSNERQSARMSKITNDSWIRSGTRFFRAVWQQWTSKGNISLAISIACHLQVCWCHICVMCSRLLTLVH